MSGLLNHVVYTLPKRKDGLYGKKALIRLAQYGFVRINEARGIIEIRDGRDIVDSIPFTDRHESVAVSYALEVLIESNKKAA